MPAPKDSEWRRREEDLVRQIALLFGEQEEEILRRIQAGELDLGQYWNQEERRWNDKLRGFFIGTVTVSFLLDMARLFGGQEAPDDYQPYISLAAQNYANDYAGRTIHDITNTSRDLVGGAVANYIGSENVTFDDLKEALRSAGFSESRASQIAITETTRAMYHGEETSAGYLREKGFGVIRRWYTVQDDRVCPICAPLHGLEENEYGGWGPDGITPSTSHIGCRCRTISEIT